MRSCYPFRTFLVSTQFQPCFTPGIGFGLIYLPAVVCVGYYFETKRSLATGIAVCGSGFGTFAFAPLASLLIEEYSWKGANLILAGLILNCAVSRDLYSCIEYPRQASLYRIYDKVVFLLQVFGALMRPLEYPKASSVKPLLQRMAEEKRFQMERGSIGGSYFMVQLPDGSMEKRMKMPINIDPGVHSSFNLDQLVPGQAPAHFRDNNSFDSPRIIGSFPHSFFQVPR